MGGQKATPEKKKDMLTFRQIGEQSFQHYVKHRILQQPSTDDAPLRRQKLLLQKKNTQLTPVSCQFLDKNHLRLFGQHFKSFATT